ncbi:MAG: glycosyltransferase [Clostridia bacterium]|nr:glycosyltransferase [Clostridia bacterium]
MVKKLVGVCANFGNNEKATNGQVIKTQILLNELKSQLGKVEIVNTNGGFKDIFKITKEFGKLCKKCKNVVILPAQNGLKLFLPLSFVFGKIHKTKIHYVVVGAWLAEILSKNPILLYFAKRIDMIYPETTVLCQSLKELGITNTQVMPNFKYLNIVEKPKTNHQAPFRLCTFSRVMEEKGIEDAIKVVKRLNSEAGKTLFTLDIYGEIDSEYEFRFNNLRANFPDSIKYRGVVEFDKSTFVLKDYFALLFPTKFKTEGHPGTILDAYAAGVPVIARRWNSADEIIFQMQTGMIYNEEYQLGPTLLFASEHGDIMDKLRYNCILKAEDYKPSNIITLLIENLQ